MGIYLSAVITTTTMTTTTTTTTTTTHTHTHLIHLLGEVHHVGGAISTGSSLLVSLVQLPQPLPSSWAIRPIIIQCLKFDNLITARTTMNEAMYFW